MRERPRPHVGPSVGRLQSVGARDAHVPEHDPAGGLLLTLDAEPAWEQNKR